MEENTKMELNLLINGVPINGYLNIDPLASDEEVNNGQKVKGELDNLDDYVDDAECVEILAVEVLEYISMEKADSVLNHWLSKLRMGGTITIGATNFRQVCRSVASQTIDNNAANLLLYGKQTHELEYKKGLVDLARLCAVLEAKGLQIIQKRLDGFKMFVTAQRI